MAKAECVDAFEAFFRVAVAFRWGWADEANLAGVQVRGFEEAVRH